MTSRTTPHLLTLLACSVLSQPVLAVSKDELKLNQKPLSWQQSREGIWQADVSLTAGIHQLQTTVLDAKAEKLPLYRKYNLNSDDNGPWQFTLKQATGVRLVLDNREGKQSLRLVPQQASFGKQDANQKQRLACMSGKYSQIDLAVNTVFNDGDWLHDAYSGKTVQVKDGRVRFNTGPDSNGLLLLEKIDSPPQPFSWRNASVYFITTDRFYNGDPSNDNSYGRQPDDRHEIGTFHGGDLAGIEAKLDYLEQLGVNALWLSAPYEQIHGWVGGGKNGDFKHYAYHGYYALDFTTLDANMGTPEQLRSLVDNAHKRGIRILFDVVMNHPGYSTLRDMQQLRFGDLRQGMAKYLPPQWDHWQPESYESFHDYHNLVDYDGQQWQNWWGPDWVRAGIGGYEQGPTVVQDPLKGSLAFLPDFKTESESFVSLPMFLKNKPDTQAVERPHYRPRDYLVEWLSQWVADYGIDGFRIDTAKHVGLDAWQQLKTSAEQAQQRWQQQATANDYQPQPFWMVGEVWGQGPERNQYHDNGFDALINFDFQSQLQKSNLCLNQMESIYQDYAKRLTTDSRFNLMSYISSHDTKLFTQVTQGDLDKQKQAGTALMLLPGAVQLYYGDESARRFGATGSDPQQGTRSDMNWGDLSKPDYQALLTHWQKLGQFRQRHPAIGEGTHRVLSTAPYSFARSKGDDRVIVIYTGEN